ncbi:ATP-binding protein [Stenotrophomonas geniculata]|uniref:hybrid sensor histidine kinase/response regulator n=1 Tax=Stenotrophomonas geniculata TaxID=86188 RepID=UPI003AAA2368
MTAPPTSARYAAITDLAQMSLRTRALLIFALVLAIVMVALCFWVINSLISLASSQAQAHFQQLVYVLHSQDSFLTRASENNAVRLSLAQGDAPSAWFALIDTSASSATYEGQPEILSMPYVIEVGQPHAEEIMGNDAHMRSTAVNLSSLYGAYRSSWQRPGMQALLIDMNASAGISVPCSGDVMTDSARRWWRCPLTMDRVRHLISSSAGNPTPEGARWLSVGELSNSADSTGYLLYRVVQLPDQSWLPDTPRRQLVLASFVEMRDGATGNSTYVQSYFRSLKAVVQAPDASMHSEHGPLEKVRSHVHFGLTGAHIDVKSHDGWIASYFVPYDQFFLATPARLIGFIVLVLVSTAGGIFLYRRHRDLIVIPAQASHNRVVESESFNLAVIDAARVAVCALRVGDHQIVAKNNLADEWLAGVEVLDDVICPGGTLIDAGEVELNGRHLSFTSAKLTYHGEETILVTFSDITDHIRIQYAMAEASRAADEANAGKTVFLATMSHEIRTPLYGALGTVELLALTPLDDVQKSYVRTIQASSSALLNVISDILDVSKIESRQLNIKDSILDLVALTEEVLSSYAATAEAKGLQLISTISPQIPLHVRGDGQRIKQVISNLISNAIKFTDVGWIRLDLTLASKGDGVSVVEWTVADTGMGILVEQQSELFRPYYQAADAADNTTPGTGLGLYICRSLCELMGGSIELRSTVGVGSTFVVRLPLRTDEGEARPESTGQLKASPRVWVRAPIRDLEQDLCAWIAFAGGDAQRFRSGALPTEEDVLVELLPERLQPIEWIGPRVLCVPNGQDRPKWNLSREIYVTNHSRSSIVEAVSLAQLARPVTESIDAARLETTHSHAATNDRPELGLRRLGLRVLVAEDNPVNGRLLMRQLEELGCVATLCSDGASALASWSGDRFDALITDINMPAMGGHDLVRTLRARRVTAPVIGLTADALQSQRDAGLAAGLNAWLSKPVDLRTLYDALSKACAAVISEWPPEPLSTTTWHSVVDDQILRAFKETMHQDIRAIEDALDSARQDDVLALLHRIRGSLAVVNDEENARFCAVLEERISEHGLNPMLENAVRSTLLQLKKKIGEM